jgi:hypothetical protein
MTMPLLLATTALIVPLEALFAAYSATDGSNDRAKNNANALIILSKVTDFMTNAQFEPGTGSIEASLSM